MRVKHVGMPAFGVADDVINDPVIGMSVAINLCKTGQENDAEIR